jgi:2-oxoglutarate dehydrogenase E1 component
MKKTQTTGQHVDLSQVIRNGVSGTRLVNAVLKRLEQTSYLYGANAAYLETLYQQYLEDPSQVPARWQTYFRQLEAGHPPAPLAPTLVATGTPEVPIARKPPPPRPGVAAAPEQQVAVLQLINAYRVRGHQHADINPLEPSRSPVPDLDPAFHGLTDQDMDTVFNPGSLVLGEAASLREILALVQQVYCGHIGSEYMHITATEEKRWIQARLEGSRVQPHFDYEFRRHLLERLTAAEGLERYLHTRYVGQKRFSLEGAESLIPLLDTLILHGGEHGAGEIVIGMAHRGRLNVLVNTLGKQPCDLFLEFEGQHPVVERAGDVKYHMGFSADADTPGGPVHIALAFNPSHLEIIGPVVEGSVRARQRRRGDREGKQVLPVLIHGDSAFAGQGVVMENFNMSQVRGFGTGGTVHIVVNNQIGFTTSNPLDTRSSLYCTDVAKIVQAPIFHVNGDDPEAVVFAAKLALDFRMQFHKDVVIDVLCYRRHGHNEADEPAVTQPMMYQQIRAHPTAREIYRDRLIAEEIVTVEQAEEMREKYRSSLDQCSIVSPHSVAGTGHIYAVDWAPYLNTEWTHAAETSLPLPRLQGLAEQLLQLPEGFEPHPRVANILTDRHKMAAGALPIDWGFAETLAYASLLDECYTIRLSGQDSGRGTFFHRHATLYNQRDGIGYTPLAHVGNNGADFIAIDTPLSEEAVLAYEYGYSTADPNSLVIWEAQFGDFANVAQVVIDQFISSGEQKWARLCRLVVFLPHGYEGQGAEHSSARLERYLQLCAQNNLQVCVPTTPAQMFHMLRRQMVRPYCKPLIVLTPKSLLRHQLSVSQLEDLSEGGFQTVIGEIDPLDPDSVRRVVICSGKVYFDLLQHRRDQARADTAILRLEQLYPFPQEQLCTEFDRYPNAGEIVWCQEEPKNQGAWYQIQHRIRTCMTRDQHLRYAGRLDCATPATGHFKTHVKEQKALVADAID